MRKPNIGNWNWEVSYFQFKQKQILAVVFSAWSGWVHEEGKDIDQQAHIIAQLSAIRIWIFLFLKKQK
jgi:hypothetical protein